MHFALTVVFSLQGNAFDHMTQHELPHKLQHVVSLSMYWQTAQGVQSSDAARWQGSWVL
jgi:hypothetical protein